MCKVDVETFIQNHTEEASRDNTRYPAEIFEQLISELNAHFSDQPYQIPSKTKVRSMQRELRGTASNEILEIGKAPLKHQG